MLDNAAILAALAAAGWSQKGAARRLGVCDTHVASRIRRDPKLLAAWQANAPRGGRVGRPAAHHALTLDVVSAAVQQHATIADAARSLGVTRNAVSRWVHAYGIARTPAEAA
jgi:transcriptional regulator with GAF, ATPase, and Fis domain